MWFRGSDEERIQKIFTMVVVFILIVVFCLMAAVNHVEGSNSSPPFPSDSSGSVSVATPIHECVDRTLQISYQQM